MNWPIISEPMGAVSNIRDALVYVCRLSDLPVPVSGVITLADNVTYYFVCSVDLIGHRIVTGQNTVILGSSSENSRITSTGLGVGVPLLTITKTCPIRHVTFEDVDTCLYVSGDSNTAIDWYGVNFDNIPNVGEIHDCGNFIYSTGAFLGSQGLRITGELSTFGVNNSLFQGDGNAGSIIEVTATANITRRFRLIYSSVVAFGSTTGITFSASATVPTESYILDTINFSGGGTYLSGIDAGSNETLFVRCVGIRNTSVNGKLSMRNNATATTIPNTTDFVKIAGTTTPDNDNEKYLHSNDRLTNDAVIKRKYLATASLSFESGANNVCEFGIYDSVTGQVQPESIISSTSNTVGRSENITIMGIFSHEQNDYLEVWVRNTSSTSSVTVTDLSFVVTMIT